MLHDTNDRGDLAVSLVEELVFPEQFFTRAVESASHWTGERRLLLAVLQEAVDSFLRHRNATTRRGKRLFREDKEWFWAKDRDELLSFESICGHLNLDPDYIRLGLTRALQETAQPVSLPQHEAGRPVRQVSLVPGITGGENRDQPLSQNACDALVHEVAA